ncbi:MAG: M15 family metallopeptidase [Bacillota bacterium]
MDRTKRRRKKKRIPRLTITTIVFLAALSLTGYHYRAQLLAFGDKTPPPAAEGEFELPPTDAEPEEPATPEPEEELHSPYPPAGGEKLEIADGDYLLALVTKLTTLGGYAPSDLVTIPAEMIHPSQRQWQYFLRREALEHLLIMAEAAREDGIELVLISAYRSYATQQTLFHDYAAAHGEEAANTFSARPGQSEHQLGTAVDFGGTASDRSQSFADTYPGIWLAENAHLYGFVMSYPAGATDVTGYIYEPWHFRYIGAAAAAAWKESELLPCVFLEQQPQRWVE